MIFRICNPPKGGFFCTSKLETIETALRLNFTFGEGSDLSRLILASFGILIHPLKSVNSKKLETIETALRNNFTSGEGSDLSLVEPNKCLPAQFFRTQVRFISFRHLFKVHTVSSTASDTGIDNLRHRKSELGSIVLPVP